MSGSASTLLDLTDSQLCAEFIRRHPADPDAAKPYLKAFVARQQAHEVGNNKAYFDLLSRLARKGGAS